MNLSPEVQARLDKARTRQQNGEYQPNERIARELARHTLVMMVGPAAIGKSTVMNGVIESDPVHTSNVRSFTTRDVRPDDTPNLYDYIQHDDHHIAELLDRIDDQDLVQYVIHPTTGRIYGSDLSHYGTDYVLMDMLSGGVDDMQHLPFKATHTIGLIAASADWARWFNDRYPDRNTERAKRVQEAGQSLEWINANLARVSLLLNKHGAVDDAVQGTFDIIQGCHTPDPVAEKTAVNCLIAAHTLGYQTDRAIPFTTSTRWSSIV